MQKLRGIELPHWIFCRYRDFRISALGIQIGSFRTEESREFSDAGPRVIISVSRTGVEDGGVEEVAATGWRRESRHVFDVFGIGAISGCDDEEVERYLKGLGIGLWRSGTVCATR